MKNLKTFLLASLAVVATVTMGQPVFALVDGRYQVKDQAYCDILITHSNNQIITTGADRQIQNTNGSLEYRSCEEAGVIKIYYFYKQTGNYHLESQVKDRYYRNSYVAPGSSSFFMQHSHRGEVTRATYQRIGDR